MADDLAGLMADIPTLQDKLNAALAVPVPMRRICVLCMAVPAVLEVKVPGLEKPRPACKRCAGKVKRGKITAATMLAAQAGRARTAQREPMLTLEKGWSRGPSRPFYGPPNRHGAQGRNNQGVKTVPNETIKKCPKCGKDRPTKRIMPNGICQYCLATAARVGSKPGNGNGRRAARVARKAAAAKAQAPARKHPASEASFQAPDPAAIDSGQASRVHGAGAGKLVQERTLLAVRYREGVGVELIIDGTRALPLGISAVPGTHATVEAKVGRSLVTLTVMLGGKYFTGSAEVREIG